MLITFYAIVAMAVAVATFLFSEWVREPAGTASDNPGAVAIAAGLLWPVLAIGLVQWLLIAALASRVFNPGMSAADSRALSMPVQIDAKP
jgi:hypothetical protein